MRKYAIGFLCGLLIASASAVYASDVINVTLFPAKYEFNGVSIEQNDEYQTFNFNGRVYVPIRFVAENLDAVVAYDEATKGIKIDTDFKLTSISSEVKAGHIRVERNQDTDTSTINGQLYAGQSYWDALSTSKMMIEPGSIVNISAYVTFYDKNNKIIDKVPITSRIKNRHAIPRGI